jgi:hypothetical protein
MRFPIVTLAFLLLAGLARATTVVPPTFPELVSEADAIYRGHVTGVEARHVARPDGSAVIKTFVTVAVERTLKGTAQNDITLEFLGGRIGDETLQIAGTPQFNVGDYGILFVQGNGRQFAPLARFTHGRYRIEHDTTRGVDYVARENHAPLADVAEVEQSMAEGAGAAASPAAIARALTPAAFESRIVSEVTTPTLNLRPN